MTHQALEERKKQWTKDILEQTESGLCAAAWCRQQGIAVHLFYHWRARLFAKGALDKSSFTEIVNGENPHTDSSGVTLEYQGVQIRLSQGFAPSVLKSCLEVLKEC